jgi:hypothetical protein
VAVWSGATFGLALGGVLSVLQPDVPVLALIRPVACLGTSMAAAVLAWFGSEALALIRLRIQVENAMLSEVSAPTTVPTVARTVLVRGVAQQWDVPDPGGREEQRRAWQRMLAELILAAKHAGGWKSSQLVGRGKALGRPRDWVSATTVLSGMGLLDKHREGTVLKPGVTYYAALARVSDPRTFSLVTLPDTAPPSIRHPRKISGNASNAANALMLRKGR